MSRVLLARLPAVPKWALQPTPHKPLMNKDTSLTLMAWSIHASSSAHRIAACGRQVQS